MAKYTAQIDDLRERTKLLAKNNRDVMQAFNNMSREVMKDGVLTNKEKEFIALGIAVVIRCENCIISHLNSLKKLGVSYEEVSEIVEVAILMGGGPSTGYASRALDIAKEMLEVE